MEQVDVKSSNDLQQYLQESSYKSTRLYHYTTLESLICIIKNKTFRLSRMDLMNDKAEQKLGKQDDHLHNYVMSFTREKEYVSMWAIYGRKSGIKLRLDVSRALLDKAINNNFYFDAKCKERIPLITDPHPGHFSKKDWMISDIVYIDKKTHSLRHDEKSFPDIAATDEIIDDHTGLIKYDAWEFEQEIRLKAALKERMYTVSREPSPEYIYAGIDKELIQDFHITYNPWMSREMKDVVKNSLNQVSNMKLSYHDSAIDGEVSEL